MSKLIELLVGDSESRYSHFNNTLEIKQTKRELVKHYPIQTVCENQEQVESAVASMVDAQWLTFKHNYAVAFNEKYPNVSFDEILSSGYKVGAVLVCPPHRFMHINNEVEAVKPFVFQYQMASGKIDVRVEMNYSFEIY
jgi:hypothetical protein